jgi:hypothetical protein
VSTPSEFAASYCGPTERLVDLPATAQVCTVLGAVKQTTLDRACGPEPGPRWRRIWVGKWMATKGGSSQANYSLTANLVEGQAADCWWRFCRA